MKILAIILFLSSAVSNDFSQQNVIHKENKPFEKELDAWFLLKKETDDELVDFYIQKENFVQAILYANNLIASIESDSSEIETLIDVYSKKVTCLYYLKEYEKAIQFNDKRYLLLLSTNDTISIINNITRSGILSQETGLNKKAIVYYKSAMDICRASAIPLTDYILTGLTVAFHDIGQFDSSIHYNRMGIDLRKLLNPKDSVGLSVQYNNLGATHYDLGKYKMSLAYLDSSNIYAGSPSNYPAGLLANYYKTHFHLGDLINTNKYMVLYMDYIDSIHAKRTHAEIIELEKLHAEKTQRLKETHALTVQNLQHQKTIFTFIMVIMSGGVILLIYLFYNSKKKKNLIYDKTLIEQRLLRSQMNPHFIFNTLAVIQSQVELKQPLKAAKYLNDFAKLMRVTLENSDENVISIESELEGIEKYLLLQKMRYEDRFDYQIDVRELKNRQLMVPPMLIQPFVENAVQHGLAKLKHGGSIVVQIIENENYVTCVIDDNGVGMQDSKKTKKSMSTRIVRRRLKILSKELKQEAKLTITDKNEISDKNSKSGVRVTIKIPYIY